MKLNILIIILSTVFFPTCTIGQQIKSKSKCYLISILMNSEQKWISLPTKSNDSIVNFLDPEHLLDSCNFTTWRGFKINIINSGTFIDSVRRKDLWFLTRDKPNNYYAIREYKEKGIWELFFRHGYNNTFVQASLKKKGNWYYLGKINAYVE
jgi:hypothetical protein